jgi:hypothetical protein
MSAINLQRFISMCSSAAPGQLISKAGTRNSCKLKLGLTPGVAEQYQDRNEGLMPALHELPDKELREKLSTGELSDRKATIARALLRRRRQKRFQSGTLGWERYSPPLD